MPITRRRLLAASAAGLALPSFARAQGADKPRLTAISQWTAGSDGAAISALGKLFEDHGGMTRANGDRFRAMVLSRGNTEDLAKMYAAWLGTAPNIEPMLKYRGLEKAGGGE